MSNDDDRPEPATRGDFVTDPEFLAMVTHELAGPLNAVLLQSQLLARKLRDHQESHRAEALIANTRRVVAVLQGFRRMLGRDVPGRRRTPWPEMLRDALDVVGRRLAEPELEVGEAPDVDVLGSSDDVGELLVQLVRYVGQPQESTEPVWVTSATTDGHLVLRVGMGDGEATEGRGEALAPPFDDLGPARVEGIGLHLAWYLAASNDGALYRSTEDGGRYALYVELPLAEA